MAASIMAQIAIAMPPSGGASRWWCGGLTIRARPSYRHASSMHRTVDVTEPWAQILVAVYASGANVDGSDDHLRLAKAFRKPHRKLAAEEINFAHETLSG